MVVLQVEVLALQLVLDDMHLVDERTQLWVIAGAEVDLVLFLSLVDDLLDLFALVVDEVLDLALDLLELLLAVVSCVENLLEGRQVLLDVLADLLGRLEHFLLGLES